MVPWNRRPRPIYYYQSFFPVLCYARGIQVLPMAGYMEVGYFFNPTSPQYTNRISIPFCTANSNQRNAHTMDNLTGEILSFSTQMHETQNITLHLLNQKLKTLLIYLLNDTSFQHTEALTHPCIMGN